MAFTLPFALCFVERDLQFISALSGCQMGFAGVGLVGCFGCEKILMRCEMLLGYLGLMLASVKSNRAIRARVGFMVCFLPVVACRIAA